MKVDQETSVGGKDDIHAGTTKSDQEGAVMTQEIVATGCGFLRQSMRER